MAGDRTVHIAAGGGVELAGDLAVPDTAFGLVLFAHGTGSSRHSRRNQAVAVTLRDRGMATLLLDLLTKGEEAVDLFPHALQRRHDTECVVKTFVAHRASATDRLRRRCGLARIREPRHTRVLDAEPVSLPRGAHGVDIRSVCRPGQRSENHSQSR
jgi:hypothetical protein